MLWPDFSRQESDSLALAMFIRNSGFPQTATLSLRFRSVRITPAQSSHEDTTGLIWVPIPFIINIRPF